ncbi:prolyl oligopeptidase family serine peptidase [Sutcliffiella cohnii]
MKQLKFNKPSVEQFFRVYFIQNFAVSPDESQLVFSSNFTGHYNLWAMDLPSQFPYQLTFHNQSCHSVQYSKDGSYILASFDEDGNELTQLFALPNNGGELKKVRYEAESRHMNPIFSEDGKTLYYTSTKNNPTYLNAYKYDVDTEEESLLLEGEAAPTYLADVSKDGQKKLVIKHFANTYTLAYLVDGDSVEQITPQTEKQHTVSDIVFASDNTIYLTTNYDDDFSYLARYDMETKTFTRITHEDNLDFEALKLDKDRNLLYLTSTVGVEDELYSYDLKSETLAKVDIPVDVVDKVVVAKSGAVYLLGRTAIKPFNIFRKKLSDNVWEQLTNFNVPGVTEEELCDPEVLKYPSYDGLEMEALFFRAKEEVSNGHVILWPHGGPQASERKFFRSYFQYLIHRGYSIFAPNFRGSSGYGLSFMKMVEGDWGHGPRLDNIQGLEWLIENGYAQRDKILLMGGSYGGYMALLLHGRHPEYFKAVIDIFGVSNLFSFIDSVPEHWKPAMKQWVGDPVEDKERLTVDSPITYLDTMTQPMLIIQGANDPRVVKAESDQIVEALKAKGRDVQYLVLNDEGHGFTKKENEITVYKTILEFLDKYIK